MKTMLSSLLRFYPSEWPEDVELDISSNTVPMSGTGFRWYTLAGQRSHTRLVCNCTVLPYPRKWESAPQGRHVHCSMPTLCLLPTICQLPTIFRLACIKQRREASCRSHSKGGARISGKAPPFWHGDGDPRPDMASS